MTIGGGEGIDDSITAGEDDLGLTVNATERWRRPGTVEDAGTDSFGVLSEQLAGPFVQDDQAGGIGCADLAMGVIDAIPGIDVKLIAVDQE